MTTEQVGPPSPDDPTIGRLVADTTRDFSALLKGELELAKAELGFDAKMGGIGVALLALAGFFVLLAIVLVSFAAAYGIAYLPHIGIAVGFLIVFGIYLLIAALLAFIGVRKIKKVRAPEMTIEAVKSTAQVIKRS